MKTSKPAGEHLHDWLHRLPGMPAHARADALNASAPRGLRNRPLRNSPLRNRDGHHERPPRLLAGWQAWIGRRFGRGQR
jgi:hypothetical protein